MTKKKLLLCTDMDRTVIPNGRQPEEPTARQRFSAFCHNDAVTLVYVTGRHQSLVQKAIKSYNLPAPDYVIADVGTKIYHVDASQWHTMSSWEQEIAKDWQHKTHQQIKDIIGQVPNLSLQERSKQNTHKLSYYLPLYIDKDAVINQMHTNLEQHNIAASLVWSIDEPQGIGLLDVLPKHATKLHAILFLQQYLGFAENDIVFAGDSGNDLPVLESSIQSVLVANASQEVRQTAQQLATKAGHSHSLYLANGGDSGLNGNYSAGVLEGVSYFMPELRSLIQQET